MRTTKIFKELLMGGIVVAPLVYFLYLWNTLPTEIPIHFDAQGNPDNYGSREYIALTLLFISIGTYLFLLYIPRLDPKKNFTIFRDTFAKLRFILTLFFSCICFIIIASVKSGVLNTTYFYILFAIMISLFGNYMSNIRPNYFLGIRTPWALENESNWKKTHFVTGRIWFFSGIALVISIITLPDIYLLYVFIGFIMLLAIFPIIYSYSLFSKENRPNKRNPQKEIKTKPGNHTHRNESDVWFYVFYINRNDSRIIVPKRNKMMGWTLNFGNPYTYVLILVFVGLIILSNIIV